MSWRRFPLTRVDAFADRPFTGNPAAVMPLEMAQARDVFLFFLVVASASIRPERTCPAALAGWSRHASASARRELRVLTGLAGRILPLVRLIGRVHMGSDLRRFIMATEFLRIYANPDLFGVELGGALKNVIAIGAGMADGIGFGANARTALITRGLAEMCRLGCALGAKKETFMGMAGLGDLVLTCTDNQSRNRRFGLLLGEGKGVDEAMTTIGQVVEGYRNAKEVFNLAQRVGVEMPITEQIYQVLYQGKNVKLAAQDLLGRERKDEIS